MQAIYFLLGFIQIVNIITAIITIIFGIKYFSKLSDTKILYLIPVISLVQIIASEVIRFSHLDKYVIPGINITIADLYVCIEFLLLVFYFWKIKETLLEKVFIIISVSAIIIISGMSQIANEVDKFININTLLLLEGPIFLTLAVFFLVRSMRNKSVPVYISNPKVIATLGIFLSFLILWPTNLLHDFFLKSPTHFYDFLFISNSVSYFIFFSSLIYSADVTRK